MHLLRKASSTKLPIKRKGTKYIARASSHLDNSVPVVIAVRDMLKLAKTASDVKRMVHNKMLKINGRPVKDIKESIRIFNLFEADKIYILTLLPTRKFVLEEAKREDRLCRVIGKTILKKGTIQLNLHDGSNAMSDKESIFVGDSVSIDKTGKITSHLPLEKGAHVFIIAGSHLGSSAVIQSIENNNVNVKIKGGEVKLTKDLLFVVR